MAPAPPDLPPDRILLRGHVREVEIGAFSGERGRRQRVRFDLRCDVRRASADDDVDEVLSYDALVAAVDAGLAGGHLALLETLAERVAADILRHPGALRVRVRVAKLDLGPHRLGVEIVRDRATATASDAPGRPRAARVVLLAPGAPADPGLPAAVAALGPGTLLVATPDAPPPPCPERAATRRIALLGLEQAAWQLSAAAPACAVAGSRTELDALLERPAPVIWAAPRMVLDATDAPATIGAASVADWLARRLGAPPVMGA